MRKPDEPGARVHRLMAADRRAGAAPPVPVSQVLAAHPFARVLPDGDDDHVGVRHRVSGADQQCAARRAGLLHRRRAAVGHPVSGTARRVAVVFRGNVLAQSREPLRQSVASLGADRRAARPVGDPDADRRRRRRTGRLAALSLFDLLDGVSAAGVLHQFDRARMVDRPRRVGDGAALGARRRRACVGGNLPACAGVGGLLSGLGVAIVAAAVRLHRSGEPCLRRDARGAAQ